MFEAVDLRTGPCPAAGRTLEIAGTPHQPVHGRVDLRRTVALPWPGVPGRGRGRGDLRARHRRDAARPPWEPLLRPDSPPRLHTDAIILDNFTHLLGCWGLDELADAGDVVFPLGMEELQLFGDRPPVGTDVACRIAILDGAAPHPRGGRDRPPRRHRLDAHPRLGRLAVPLAGPVSRRLPQSARGLRRRGAAARRRRRGCPG